MRCRIYHIGSGWLGTSTPFHKMGVNLALNVWTVIYTSPAPFPSPDFVACWIYLRKCYKATWIKIITKINNSLWIQSEKVNSRTYRGRLVWVYSWPFSHFWHIWVLEAQMSFYLCHKLWLEKQVNPHKLHHILYCLKSIGHAGLLCSLI